MLKIANVREIKRIEIKVLSENLLIILMVIEINVVK